MPRDPPCPQWLGLAQGATVGLARGAMAGLARGAMAGLALGALAVAAMSPSRVAIEKLLLPRRRRCWCPCVRVALLESSIFVEPRRGGVVAREEEKDCWEEGGGALTPAISFSSSQCSGEATMVGRVSRAAVCVVEEARAKVS